MQRPRRRQAINETITWTIGLAVVLVALTVLAASAQEAEGRQASAGISTQEQIDRGLAVIGENCTACHGSQLEGGQAAPSLAPLGDHWRGLSVAALFRFVSSNMPMTAPGSLEPQEYADAVAAILNANGYPLGDAELPPEPEPLEGIVIDDPPGDDAAEEAADDDGYDGY